MHTLNIVWYPICGVCVCLCVCYVSYLLTLIREASIVSRWWLKQRFTIAQLAKCKSYGVLSSIWGYSYHNTHTHTNTPHQRLKDHCRKTDKKIVRARDRDETAFPRTNVAIAQIHGARKHAEKPIQAHSIQKSHRGVRVSSWEGESQFSLSVAPGNSITLQWKATYPRAYGQHKSYLVFVCYLFVSLFQRNKRKCKTG